MFSGYHHTANNTRSLFYLLVHANKQETDESAPSASVPLVIWLQGGNGCSSMLGAFTENGPYLSPQSAGEDATLRTNPSSWHQLAHVLYLDRPAGAGFSYAQHAPNHTWANDAQTAADSVAVLRGLVVAYPWLCGRTVWVAGESYAGHFTVQLATAISAASEEGGLCVGVGGVLVGNGVVDINQTNYAWFEAGSTHTLVEEAVWEGMRAACDFTKDLGIDGNGCPRGVSAACAALVDVWMNQSGAAVGALSLYDYYTDVCLDPNTTDPNAVASATAQGITPPPVDVCAESHTEAYLNLPGVKHALHVAPLFTGTVVDQTPCTVWINSANLLCWILLVAINRTECRA